MKLTTIQFKHIIHVRKFFIACLLMSCMGSSFDFNLREAHFHYLGNFKLIKKKNLCSQGDIQNKAIFLFCYEEVTGVLDRFENNLALILIEEINQEIIIPKHLLPRGSDEGTWFHLKGIKGNYKIVDIDHYMTEQALNHSAHLILELQQK